MEKFKALIKKITKVLRTVFACGILLSLFVGGLSLFGYVAALFIGGDTAAQICTFLSKGLMPYVVKASTAMVVLGVVIMYLDGETALTSSKKKAVKSKTEM